MKRVLVLASLFEAATGAGLLIVPALVGRLLLKTEFSGVSLVIARVTGIALLALGIACCPGRMNPFRGMLIYNALTAAFLIWAAGQREFVGPLFWPVVLLHVLMTVLLVVAGFMGQSPNGQGNQDRGT